MSRAHKSSQNLLPVWLLDSIPDGTSTYYVNHYKACLVSDKGSFMTLKAHAPPEIDISRVEPATKPLEESPPNPIQAR